MSEPPAPTPDASIAAAKTETTSNAPPDATLTSLFLASRRWLEPMERESPAGRWLNEATAALPEAQVHHHGLQTHGKEQAPDALQLHALYAETKFPVGTSTTGGAEFLRLGQADDTVKRSENEGCSAPSSAYTSELRRRVQKALELALGSNAKSSRHCRPSLLSRAEENACKTRKIHGSARVTDGATLGIWRPASAAPPQLMPQSDSSRQQAARGGDESRPYVTVGAGDAAAGGAQ